MACAAEAGVGPGLCSLRAMAGRPQAVMFWHTAVQAWHRRHHIGREYAPCKINTQIAGMGPGASPPRPCSSAPKRRATTASCTQLPAATVMISGAWPRLVWRRWVLVAGAAVAAAVQPGEWGASSSYSVRSGASDRQAHHVLLLSGRLRLANLLLPGTNLSSRLSREAQQSSYLFRIPIVGIGSSVDILQAVGMTYIQMYISATSLHPPRSPTYSSLPSPPFPSLSSLSA